MQNKQHKIDFIIKAAGGDSLSHVIKKLGSIEKDLRCSFIPTRGFCFYNLIKSGAFCWKLTLIDTKEAKLQDQSPETLNSLATILGYENE